MPRIIQILVLIATVSGCSQSSSDYFPLGNNSRWIYTNEIVLNGKKSISKIIVINDLSVNTADENVFARKSASGKNFYFRKTSGAIYSSSDINRIDNVVLKLPLVKGTQWNSTSRVFVLGNYVYESYYGGESFVDKDDHISLDYEIEESDETITVSAGKFLHCVKIVSRGTRVISSKSRGIDSIVVEQTEWYAPGRGLVKLIRNESTIPAQFSGSLQQELYSYN